MSPLALRRYYLLASVRAEAWDDHALASAWHGKQLAEPGTPLPEGFPLRERLPLARYHALEDLEGADEDELYRAGFSPSEARAVLSARDSA